MQEWGNCLKYLKMGWNRKEGKGNKDFKKGGQVGPRGGCLKKGRGAGTPLLTMVMIIGLSCSDFLTCKMPLANCVKGSYNLVLPQTFTFTP